MKIDHLTPDQMILKELGHRLSRIRKQRQLSQEKLAKEAGIGVATLRRIEDGKDSHLGSWLKILKAVKMTSSIQALLPERFSSPMAEATAQRRRSRKKKRSFKTHGWGDNKS